MYIKTFINAWIMFTTDVIVSRDHKSHEPTSQQLPEPNLYKVKPELTK